MRLAGVALLGVQITIIALATSASATQRIANSEPKRSPTLITRHYAIEGAIETARWYADLAKADKPVELARARPRHAAIRISNTRAVDWLHDAGVRAKSSGHCTDRRQSSCTSLEAVRTSTITSIIALRQESGCPILVTGGTESGHAPGRYSHGQGYKLDITHNTCIDHYITNSQSRSGVRGDGSTVYRTPTGTVFASESSHWDILFR
ncbi:hypothetical protein ACIBHX_48205 [Nonomuraea sp. NPDC050536]|uniref:hypothetical protein n=1 Tax=Nonomuraea sp. NPDC050536 TaxID=3364366 RepID=UPI0037CB917A